MPEELSPPPIREFADRGIKWLLETPENVRSLLRLLAGAAADHAGEEPTGVPPVGRVEGAAEAARDP